jgi:hypothetical protein
MPWLGANPVLSLADEISQNDLHEIDGKTFQHLALFLARLNGDFRWRRVFGNRRPKRGRASFVKIGDERV